MRFHADINGAFDEKWKPQQLVDGARLSVSPRTQKVIDRPEGQDSYGAKVNGKLTVSENVADLWWQQP